MSADSWSICPKCHEKHDVSLVAFDRKVQDAYGEVPAEEYIRLLAELKEMENEKEEYTLRENYSQGIVDDEYCLRYSAGCTVCGWQYEKKINERVYP